MPQNLYQILIGVTVRDAYKYLPTTRDMNDVILNSFFGLYYLRYTNFQQI